MNPEEARRLVEQHTGRTDLPRSVARAIWMMTRTWPKDVAVWAAAARCLRSTNRATWALHPVLVLATPLVPITLPVVAVLMGGRRRRLRAHRTPGGSRTGQTVAVRTDDSSTRP
jgi:hypothetical protein